MQENFKYTDEFFREYEEKYMPKQRTAAKSQPPKPKKKPKVLILVCAVIITVFLVVLIIPKNNSQEPSVQVDKEPENVNLEVAKPVNPYREPTEHTALLVDEVNSNFAVLINADTGEIIAHKNYNERMYPASLTKIMTLLVALDNVTDLNDTYEMSYRIIDPLYRQGASLAGFSSGEKVKIIDLLYGVILPSGADATCGVADYVSGSEEAFVQLMNKKAEKLGLKNTHFANSSGLYDENNYTTAYDMALILKAAMENDLAKKIMTTSQYTSAATEQHPTGIWMDSTLSHYIKGNEPTNDTEILGGKTGYVSQSGNCIASFARSESGYNYICVSGKAESGKFAAKDHINIYSEFAN